MVEEKKECYWVGGWVDEIVIENFSSFEDIGDVAVFFWGNVLRPYVDFLLHCQTFALRERERARTQSRRT